MTSSNNQIPVIFLAFANYYGDPGKYLRNLPAEQEEISAALHQAEIDGLCQIVVQSNATIEQIIRVFQDKRYKDRIAVFHFAGHAESYELILETPFREAELVYADGFVSFLKEQKGLKLIFLNGCLTQKQADMLVDQGVPAVIATGDSVLDNVAKKIAVYFYGFLGAGDPVLSAFNKAIGLVKSQHDSGSVRRDFVFTEGAVEKETVPWKINIHPESREIENWNLPEAVDNPLYNLPPLPQTVLPTKPFPGLKAYDEAFAEVFWGRNWEIKALYEMITSPEAPKITILYGAGGVGKTSLLRAGVLPRLKQRYLVYYTEFDSKSPAVLPEKAFAEIASKDEFISPVILLDGLERLDSRFAEEEILLLLNQFVSARLVLCVDSFYFLEWEAFLRKAGKRVQTYLLKPLNADGFEEVVRGLTSTKRLKDRYQAEIEPVLPARMKSLLLKDAQSPLSPILQYILSAVWDLAKEKNYDQPRLDWNLCLELESSNIWRRYINQKLVEVAPEAYESGLLFNLLETCLEKYEREEEIEARYRRLGDKIQKHIYDLKKINVLSNPAVEKTNLWSYLILTHDILKIPIYGMINQSQAPGQQAKRILAYQQMHHIPLKQSQLKMIQSAREALPDLSEDQTNFVLSSESILKEQRRRRRFLLIFRIVLVVFVLGFGMLIDNPYLLFFVLLIVILYKL